MRHGGGWQGGAITRAVILLALVWTLAPAQTPVAPSTFAAVVSETLAAAAHQTTVVQPTNGSKRIWFRKATVYCSVSCTVSFVRNGTAPSGSASAPVKATEHVSGAATAALYVGSDTSAGEGAVTHGPWPVSAGSPLTFDLSEWTIGPDGAGKNLTVKVDSMTGTYRLYLSWWEM